MSDKLTTKYRKLIGAPFTVESVSACNFRPHRYTVGRAHIKYASKRGGVIDETVMNEVGCAFPGCRLPLSDHSHDTVMFLQLTRDATRSELVKAIVPLKAKIEKDGIDGIAFLETADKFRVREG